ncbi:MAG TPA: bifunctional phosphoglucose/phosphomannose isomerase [Chloroflexota bacterium]|nr:bifunctional phosphoglucose/phosphomannose isomerase [Chloroflexota bacterium]
MFLDESLETADRERLTAHQLGRLREGLRHVLDKNPFYSARLRDAGLESSHELRSLEDLARLPFTTKQELVQDQTANPPFGTNLSEPLEAYVRLFQTSGTTGRPLRWLDTAESLEWIGRLWHVGLLAAGVTASDRIFYAFGFGPFLAFWGCWQGAHALGALSVPGGGLHTDQRIAVMLDNEVTALACTPTYALRVAEVAAEQGIDLRDSPIRITLHGGEPGASVPSTKRRIEEQFGARCMDTCGMTEAGHMGWECWAEPGGIHLNEGEFIFEVIDPISGQPLPSGQRGELVVTNLGRWGMPIIRYRTGDLVELDSEQCECGRTYVRARGGVVGRRDDMLVVRGVNVFPSSLEDLIRRDQRVAEFRVDATRTGGLTDLLIQIELDASVSSDEARESAARAIAEEIRRSIGLRLTCQPVAPGSLPRFELKARRVVIHEVEDDRRPTTGDRPCRPSSAVCRPVTLSPRRSLMVDLDQPSTYAELDRSGMLSRVLEMDRQAEDAWRLATTFEAPAEYGAARQVVVLGMGGSAIGGDLVRTLVSRRAAVPILVCREYELPAFVGPDTLAIASSYSGDTEETLSATEQALAAGARVIAVSTGGRLAELAAERGLPLLHFSYSAQPRAALGYSLFLILGLLARLEYLEASTLKMEEALAAIRAKAAECGPEKPTSANPAKELATALHGSLPVIYGGGILAEVARRWKGQFNENAKQWSFFEQLPEVNHNAVLGYEYPPELGGKIVVLLLSSPLNHPRIGLRERATAELLGRAGVRNRVLRAEGQGELAQVCSLVVLGDLVTYYLALLNGADPSTVENIDYLKAELAKAPV